MSYTIGQVAEKLGISTYALRYYEKEGLLPDVKRNPNGIRIFEESDLHFLYVVFCLKNTGMSIEEIRTFIQWAKEGDASLEKRYQLFVERRDAVDRQMEQLKAYRQCIEDKCQYYKEALEAGTEAVHFQKEKKKEKFPLGDIVKLEDE